MDKSDRRGVGQVGFLIPSNDLLDNVCRIIVECNMFFLANSILQFGLQCNCIWRSISTWWGQIKPPMTDHG